MQSTIVKSALSIWVGGLLCSTPLSVYAQPQEENGAKQKQYCNQAYMYCVELPSIGTVQPHLDDSPNHGVSIDLSAKGNEIWSYAHWDAVLLKSAQQAALLRLGLLLDEHPDAEINIKLTTLAGLSAFHILLTMPGTVPTMEEIVIAYAPPEDESKGPGIIYELGVKSETKASVPVIQEFHHFVDSFRISRK
jgi:hypothetical protein